MEQEAQEPKRRMRNFLEKMTESAEGQRRKCSSDTILSQNELKNEFHYLRKEKYQEGIYVQWCTVSGVENSFNNSTIITNYAESALTN